MTTAALAPGDVAHAAPRVQSDDATVQEVFAEQRRILAITDPLDLAEAVEGFTARLADILDGDVTDPVYLPRGLAVAVASTRVSDHVSDLHKRHASLRDHALLDLLREFSKVMRDWDLVNDPAEQARDNFEITPEEYEARVAHARRIKNRRLKRPIHLAGRCAGVDRVPPEYSSQDALLTLPPREGQTIARQYRRECAAGCPVRTAWNAYDRAIYAAERVLANAQIEFGTSDAFKLRDAEDEYGRRVGLANELLAADLLHVPYGPVDVWKHLLKLKSASALNYIRSHAAGPPEKWAHVVDADQVGKYEFEATRALWYAKEGTDGLDARVRNRSYRILTSAPIGLQNAVVCEYVGMDSARFAQIRTLT